MEDGEGYQLREESGFYRPRFEAEKGVITY